MAIVDVFPIAACRNLADRQVDHHIFFMRSGQAAVYVTEEPPVWESEPVRHG